MDLAVLREDMVDGLEAAPKNVLSDETIAVAMRDVPRHAFLADERTAYADREHDAFGTRVLAPSTAARLLQALALEDDETVLIVGVGVGYTAAVAAEVVGETNVHAVDISRPLVVEARENLADAGYDGVLVDCRDGATGFPEYAPSTGSYSRPPRSNRPAPCSSNSPRAGDWSSAGHPTTATRGGLDRRRGRPVRSRLV